VTIDGDIEGGEDIAFAKGFYQEAIGLGGSCRFEGWLIGIGRKKNKGDVQLAELVGEVDAGFLAFEENIDEDKFGVFRTDLFIGRLYGSGESADLMPCPLQDLLEIAGFDELVFDDKNPAGDHNGLSNLANIPNPSNGKIGSQRFCTSISMPCASPATRSFCCY